jgi:hypothetical protein
VEKALMAEIASVHTDQARVHNRFIKWVLGSASSVVMIGFTAARLLM